MEQLHDKLKAWIDNQDREHSEGVSLLTHLTRNKRLIQSLSKSETRYKREKLLYELRKHYRPLPSITTPTEIDQDTDPDADDSAADDDMNTEKDIPPVDPAGGQSETGEIIFPVTIEGGQPGNEITSVTIEGNPLPPVTTSAQEAIVAEHLEVAYTKMYNKKGMLINSLRDVPENDNEARKVLMEQIAGINADMKAVDFKVQHFKLHGTLPALEPPVPAADINTEKPIPDDPFLMKQALLNERSNISKIKKKLKDGQVNPDKLKALEEILQKKTELVNEIERRLNGNGS